jgi:hypothetical protein
MAAYDFASKEFDDAVRAAGRRAFEESLAAGLPVFYLDDEGLNVMKRRMGGDSRSAGFLEPRPERITRFSAK